VCVLGASQVAGAELLRQQLDLGALAVVQDPRLVRQPHGHGSGHGRQQHLQRLVVGRDQDGEAHRRGRDLLRGTDGVQVPQTGHVQQQPEQRVGLQQQQGHRHPPHVEVHRLEGAPAEVQGAHGKGKDGHRPEDDQRRPALGLEQSGVRERRARRRNRW